MWSLQYLWISRCKFHRPSTHPFIHPSTHPWIHPFLHICYTYVSHMHIYIYTFARPVHEYSYMSNSPHCSKHAFTFHSPFVPRSCPRHFCCRSLILDTCTKPSAVAPSSRVTVTKAPKGTMRATTPLNHSWRQDLGNILKLSALLLTWGTTKSNGEHSAKFVKTIGAEELWLTQYECVKRLVLDFLANKCVELLSVVITWLLVVGCSLHLAGWKNMSQLHRLSNASQRSITWWQSTSSILIRFHCFHFWCFLNLCLMR